MELLQAWKVLPYLSRERLSQCERAGVNRYLAQILFNRGIERDADMRRFLAADYAAVSDPMTIGDMSRAVDRILHACSHKEHITIYGDYDADGVTAAALLFRALRRLCPSDVPLDYYVPHRVNEGFGLHQAAIEGLRRRGTSLLITADCGTSDVEAVTYANRLGIDVIITDHHHPGVLRPPAYGLINPWCLSPNGPSEHGDRYLCGVGVALKLVQALYRLAGNDSHEDEQGLLDLVAIGTIADVVPLLEDNHTFVRLGLQCLNKTQSPGLLALIEGAGLRCGGIRERDISFGLAPRINAAGRMNDAGLALQLLTTERADEAALLVRTLEGLNVQRQQITELLMQSAREQALEQTHRSVILVSGEHWHEGVIGLVAGKLARELGKPAVVVSRLPNSHVAKGSARSHTGFDMLAALDGFSDRLERYGGHEQAAGFTIQNALLADLHDHLSTWGSSISPATVGASGQYMVDFELSDAATVGPQLYELVSELAPFGQEFPEPTFLLKGLRLLDVWGKNWHSPRLKLGSASGPWSGIGSLEGGCSLLERVQGAPQVNVVFQLDRRQNPADAIPRLRILHAERA